MKDPSGCHVDRIETELEPGALGRADKAMKVIMSVSGMGCINCANRVRNGLVQTPGVLWAEVNLQSRRAYVAFDAAAVEVEDLVAAVATAGRTSNHHYDAVLLGRF